LEDGSGGHHVFGYEKRLQDLERETFKIQRGVWGMAKKKSPIDSIIIDMILDHFNMQGIMNKPEVLTGSQFDSMIKQAEEIWVHEIMIKEDGGLA
jgi:hypothetical protein|tara:strand:- start:1265 stop:1549 length:285 start_codon:yes stop_codon:yes gene_type:complete